MSEKCVIWGFPMFFPLPGKEYELEAVFKPLFSLNFQIKEKFQTQKTAKQERARQTLKDTSYYYAMAKRKPVCSFRTGNFKQYQSYSQVHRVSTQRLWRNENGNREIPTKQHHAKIFQQRYRASCGINIIPGSKSADRSSLKR